MSKTGRPAADAEFWRCGGCGTPNPWAAYLTTCVACGGKRPPLSTRPAAAGPPTNAVGSPPRRRRRALGLACVYAATVLLIWVVMRLGAEYWLPATLLLFSPRWVFLLPAAVLGGFSLWARNARAMAVNVATLAVVAGPVMGLSAPFGSLFARRTEGTTVRVMSFNRGWEGIGVEGLDALVKRDKVDLICFQEIQDNPRLDAYLAKGWHLDKTGYVASRFPIVEELPPEDPNDYPETGFWPMRIKRVIVGLPDGRRALVACIHMPTMRMGFGLLSKGDTAAAYRYQDWRWKQMDALVGRLGEAKGLPVIVGGDFNMPIDSPMMSPLKLQYRPAFAEAGWGYGYTRPAEGAFIGIDHILVSADWGVNWCHVGPDIGSDHRPLIAEVVLPPAAGKGP